MAAAAARAALRIAAGALEHHPIASEPRGLAAPRLGAARLLLAPGVRLMALGEATATARYAYTSHVTPARFGITVARPQIGGSCTEAGSCSQFALEAANVGKAKHPRAFA
jgi:hypothetical protein